MIMAIDWAIENGIDVLTYSFGALSEKNRSRVDAAVEKATEHNIVTTFIHYPYARNLFPAVFSTGETYSREPDLQIFEYDYNVVMIRSQQEYISATVDQQKHMVRPFTSVSSTSPVTSPVTAGFVALLKSIDNTLSPDDYRNILMETSSELVYPGYTVPRVPDIYAAVRHLIDLTPPLSKM